MIDEIWKIYHRVKELAKKHDLGDEILLDMAEAIGCCNTLLAFFRKYEK